MNSSEAYLELLEEILNNIEEGLETDDWGLLEKTVDTIREVLDHPFDNYNTVGW